MHFQIVADGIMRTALLLALDQALEFVQENVMADFDTLPRQLFLRPLLQLHVDGGIETPVEDNAVRLSGDDR